MNTITLQKNEHLRKQKEFIDEKIRNNTEEAARKRLIEAKILDKDGKLNKRYL